MSSQICLKWNSFLNNIVKSFENLWEEDSLVDVTLASDGKCLTAHKIILSASSPFFKKIFETNPCQHPVIILQDVHFSELEALLIFIYKGEVNIEQDQLPILLKAAETLQIRGLSGGEISANKSFKRLVDWELNSSDQTTNNSEESPKKKYKNSRGQNNNSIFEKTTAKKSRFSNSTGVFNHDKANRDSNLLSDSIAHSVYPQLEMKIEPLESIADELQKQIEDDVDQLENRFNTSQSNHSQCLENTSTQDVPGIPDNIPGKFKTLKPLLYAYQRLPYADLLPSPDVISTWASSRPMDHLACDLMKILFTPEERILCNVNGKMGKQQFDSDKIHLIREVLLHFSNISPNSIQWEETWKNCVTKIDTSNRGFKRYLFQRKAINTH
ncbi:uncharacterized protein [Chelonus insularis]|uniref:uncharacterized protein n=1 Tax=Chelonus insularis TaxID=460826 RepID=UPI00158C31A6|nr:uncharacterized protein LOC118063657 [Chelonus insularis]